jgi:hypothetical protein
VKNWPARLRRLGSEVKRSSMPLCQIVGKLGDFLSEFSRKARLHLQTEDTAKEELRLPVSRTAWLGMSQSILSLATAVYLAECILCITLHPSV